MTGRLKKAVAGLICGSGLFAGAGCYHYRQIVDPCWPERYNSMARHSVQDTFNAQAFNGHILDQTVWNYHFEVDPKTGGPTDKIHPAGAEHLLYLSRRRPAPDPKIFLQTSGDLKLDERRVAAVHAFLGRVMANRNQAVQFDVAVHDPAEVGISANPIAGTTPRPVFPGSIPQLFQNFKGQIQEQTGQLGGGGGGGGGGN